MIVGSRWTKWVLGGLALCAVSCRDGGSSGFGGDGVLGYAAFRWDCVGNGDLACEPDVAGTFPRYLALDAEFDADFRLVRGLPDSLEAGWLVWASDYGVSSSGGRFRATEEGTVTLLALTTDDAVVDFVEMEVMAVDDLQLVLDCDNDDELDDDSGCWARPVTVEIASTTVEVRVEPLGAGGERLMGDLSYQWELLTPELLDMASDDGNEAVLKLRRSGEAQIRVTGGGVERTMSFTIEPAGPLREQPGGSDDSGGETDGTTGGETDDTDTGRGSTTGGM